MAIKYKLSGRIVITKAKGAYTVYHAIYGGLCVLDDNSLALLKAFAVPRAPEDIACFFPNRSAYKINSAINEFINRKFIVTAGTDENAVTEAIKNAKEAGLSEGRQLGVVQLIVSNECNFNCKYCFIKSIYTQGKRAELQNDPDNRMMSPESAEAYILEVIKAVKNAENKTLHIQFFGGEPLCNAVTIEHVLKTFGNGSKYGLGITYSIVTNGALITEQISEYFKAYNVPVIVSFDSPNGKERVAKNGSNGFEKIKDGLIKLNRYNNRVVFNSVLSNGTFEYLDTDLIDFAILHHVREIGILLDLDPDFYAERPANAIVDKLWSIYRYGADRNVTVTGYWHTIFQQITALNSFQGRRYKTCSAAGCQLSIEPSGDIFACKGSSGYFGNIAKLDELLKSESYKQYAMRAFRSSPICDGCEIEGFCSGFCFGPLEKKHGSICAVEKNACEVYKGITRRLIESAEGTMAAKITLT